MILFFVGAPGVGKTTLVRHFLGVDPFFVMKPKWTVAQNETVVAAGHYTGGTFDGADTVPYNGVRLALDYWRVKLRAKATLTIFDGERFSNRAVVDELEKLDVVKCVFLTAPKETLEARRRERGSNQNETWLKGRVTKAANFADLFAATKRLDLVADVPSPALFAKVSSVL